MSQSVESFVQVPPDGAGKAIRNLAFVALDSDGTVRTVYAQVTVATDATTGLPTMYATSEWQQQMLGALRALVRGVAKLAEVEEEDLYNA